MVPLFDQLVPAAHRRLRHVHPLGAVVHFSLSLMSWIDFNMDGFVEPSIGNAISASSSLETLNRSGSAGSIEYSESLQCLDTILRTPR